MDYYILKLLYNNLNVNILCRECSIFAFVLSFFTPRGKNFTIGRKISFIRYSFKPEFEFR